MGFEAKVLADSRSEDGHRLTTLEVCFPRFILAEFNTHRVFSRNSASSRAIPVVKQLRRILDEPFIPLEFGTNQPGMQAGPALEGEAAATAEAEWLSARDDAVRHVLGLVSTPASLASEAEMRARLEAIEEAVRSKQRPPDWLNVHKQVANRLLEPFMWHTVIVTATEWDNFWHLRAHADAQPEIHRIATLMKEAYDASAPASLEHGDWHLPLVDDVDRDELGGEPDGGRDLIKISAGRCARVSYLTHAGKRDHSADIALHDSLVESGHMSPLEHPARPMEADELAESEFSGNFRGWHSYRKDFSHEADPLGHDQPWTDVLVTAAPDRA
jgi:thymidylate synthase ThyX